VANLLVPDLIAYQGSGHNLLRAGPSVHLQNATLTNTGTKLQQSARRVQRVRFLDDRE